MRVLAISHSCVVPEYRLRHAAVAAYDDVEVTLLTPESWMQFNQMHASPEKDPTHTYTLLRRQPWTWKLRHHGLRNVSHIYPGLRKLIREVNPDILEVWAEPFSAVAWQAGRLFRKQSPDKPFLFFSAQNINRRYPAPFRWFEMWVYKNATACLAMSHEVAQVLQTRGWEGESKVLPLGVHPPAYDCADASAAFRKAHGLEGVVIGFLGRLSAEKGVYDLANAVRELPNEPRWSLLLAGTGDAADEIRGITRSLSVPVSLAGAVPHDQVPTVLGAMDIVVVPSRTTPAWKEQFGRVVVEAFAAGKPVVTSDSGELPVVVGETGRVFPEGDVHALADILWDLLRHDETRAALAKDGLRRVKTQFAWEVIARQQVELYRKLLAP